jgi:protein CpxP
MGRLLRLSAIFALMAFITIPVLAQGEGRRRGHEAFRGRMAEALGLTAEQQSQLEEIRKADRETLRAARQRVHEARRALEEALAAETVDQALVETRTRELSEANDAMTRAMTEHTLRVREVLTPEQREKLRTMREGWRDRMDQHKRERLNRTDL